MNTSTYIYKNDGSRWKISDIKEFQPNTVRLVEKCGTEYVVYKISDLLRYFDIEE